MALVNRKNNRRFQRQAEPEHRINERIRVPEVRLVGDNVEVGVYPIEEARKIAAHLELDLVEISPNANPPVCRVVEYKKFLYEKKRKEKEMKANSKQSELKEIRFTANTDDHDFDFKAKHAERFLQDGNKVKAYVQFKGRAIMFKDRGELLLLKFAERLAEVGSLESMPKMEGRRMLAMFAPKVTKKKETGAKDKGAQQEGKEKKADKPKQPAAKAPVAGKEAE
ncbi:translation initiation factor IF-3 [Arachidicoccus rhizosphaerae]|uniref:Translation initiation factor IF-3 n=1 Tax=Arachidicoccus rhizosphaerae TaxID=551991 RepID=A0A1H3YFJ4_9BACT|nr:translation initiation factor IF-3 [Arachidicoccus rhizosphaerae]SEA10369.1 translation initiation factor IF-3 [Arachidicoccus rhizosphaerae]